MTFDCSMVEVLSELINEDGNISCAATINGVTELYMGYQDMVRNWDAELAGIIPPSADEIATARNMAANLIDGK